METVRDLADRLEQAAATVTSVAHEVAYLRPAYPAFGADGPGRLAEVGFALHQWWVSATAARAREATAAAAQLTDVAGTVRQVAASYADTDAAVAASYADTDTAAARWHSAGER